jgi:hypothetical protein
MLWYIADSTYPGTVMPFSQRYLISWVNSYHRWAAALTPPKVWTTWDITTANRHTSPSIGADFNPDDISCSHRALAVMNIVWSLRRFNITFIPPNEHKQLTTLSVNTVQTHPWSSSHCSISAWGKNFSSFLLTGYWRHFSWTKVPRT